MNKWIASGNIGNDIAVSQSSSGTTIARFSFAVRRRFAREGETDTDWFRCTCFNKTAEFASKWLHKGSKVIIEGEIQNDNYEKDGVKHYGMQIIVSNIEFGESKKEADANNAPAPQTQETDFMNIPDDMAEDLPWS